MPAVECLILECGTAALRFLGSIDGHDLEGRVVEPGYLPSVSARPLVRAPGEGKASPDDDLRADGATRQVVPTTSDVADVIYDRNMFFSSVPMGNQERVARHGHRARKGHWWMTRRTRQADD